MLAGVFIESNFCNNRFLLLTKKVNCMTFATSPQVHTDLSIEQLINIAIARREGRLSHSGALAVETGSRTGRSPKDRFIVKDSMTEKTVDWGRINQPIDVKYFQTLWEKAERHIADKEHFISHLQVGAEKKYSLGVTVTTEKAWHNIFVQHLFIQPTDFSRLADRPQWQILSASSLKTDPKCDHVNSDATIILNFADRRILLCGMLYAGEIKKAMFSALNYFLPESDVLPMHCAANMDDDGQVALFFGLSGTGKTTLSADPQRYLIGDDEHGWSEIGVFNFEGGCYAKCIDLSQEKEPVIWNAIRDGAIMENVIVDEKGVPDYSDSRLTQNTRAAYTRDYIPNCVETNTGGLPSAVLFLCCDLYGVLPPIALLSKEQAAYYFLSGYTALVGSTEVGSAAGITPTFSTCFGAPFFARPATIYADLLIKRIEQSGCQVYLVNTGWTGGAYGEGGKRFSIPTTRAVVSAVVNNSLLNVPTEKLFGFNLDIPIRVEGVETPLLNPQKLWKDQQAYRKKANILITKFQENFSRFKNVEYLVKFGPKKYS